MHEYTLECMKSLASWDKEMRSEIENNRIYEAVRSCGCHFIDNNSICGLFPYNSFHVCTIYIYTPLPDMGRL